MLILANAMFVERTYRERQNSEEKKKKQGGQSLSGHPETSGKMLKCDFSAIFTRAQYI